ncbi:CYTH and CHAD domain-containing protein [Streptomyces piniterrae]|uniref:CYTH and CHAD domain-containing protein n=1 Tax=Streptomyces piniterrae TaxID=2571125 RepID=A0A4U0NN64_9ACTN|nr:CYTH and CHAD domain-containing protein [Streptomyces piniterrae]TJZ55806.1 CYTH and CHAD domain-containing protein [Streptomyces piniterrae]
MADTVREVERKYEATDTTELPDLTEVDRVAAVVEQGVSTLDATYYDTADQRLAADGITLRRRTGGTDAGWHLKLPVAPGVRDEVRAPLSDAPPRELTVLVRSRVLDRELAPVVRLRTRRTVRVLQDADGAPLAEVAEDAVWARRAGPPGAEAGEPGTAEEAGEAGEARWHEIEVELTGDEHGADGTGLLDEVGRLLVAAGARPAEAPSKLARALDETGPRGPAESRAEQTTDATGPAPTAGPTAGEIVLRYVREQVRAIVELDPAVRRDIPDSVHRMRVATRRLRSAFRSYAKVLDRAATGPIGDELKWLAAELGVDRDREVLTERLRAGLAEVPGPLRLGPVAARLRIWEERSRQGSRQDLLAVLDGERYLALLKTLRALLDEPPLKKAAGRPAPQVMSAAVLKDYARLAGRVETALDAPPGTTTRDVALHNARKAAKRTRYAAEAATPALGKPAKKFTRRTKKVQQLLGDHQDSVVARTTLRDLATQAQHAGEGGFTFGLLYGREEALAADRERELPVLWKKVSRRKHRDALQR